MTRTTRRSFCTHACQAASLAAAGILLGGCSGGGRSPTSPSVSAPELPLVNATLSGRTVSVTVDAASPLAAIGGAARIQTAQGPFLLARTGQDQFVALDGTCTHEQCTVSGFSNGRYVCPCHGSQFTTAGTVVNGPATVSLRQYPVSFAGNVVSFTI